MLEKGLQLLEKCGLFSNFQYGFRSSRSTADLLTVVSDRIARAFNRFVVTQAVALDISMLILAHKLKSYGTIRADIFPYFVFSGWAVSQEYPLNAGVS